MARHRLVGQGLIIVASRSHLDTLHSVELLRTSDQPNAETSTCQNTTLTRDKYPRPPVGFEHANSGSERPQTHALDCAATGIGLKTLE